MALENPLRAWHEKAGAASSEYFGCLLPKRLGDIAAEYRLARETVALVDTNYHALIYVDGPDRVRYLNALLTNNIKDLAAGQGNVSLLLSAQGHILAEIETYALTDRLLTLSHALARARTAQTLEKFIIMDDVTLDDVTERLGSVALEGPQAAAMLRGLGGPDLETMEDRAHSDAKIASIPCRVIHKSLFGEKGAELVVQRNQLTALWQALLEAARAYDGGPIGYAALNALRLEAGIPWFGYDFDDKYIPHEATLETSHISYTKGCYTGQEIVERVRSRGHVNRRRVGLRFAGLAIPESGAALSAGGKEVGHITSAARSPALDCVIGMGYLRREHNALGSQVQWASGEAEVIELPVAAVKTAQRTQES